jgi:hypothetical protein
MTRVLLNTRRDPEGRYLSIFLKISPEIKLSLYIRSFDRSLSLAGYWAILSGGRL